MEAEWRRSHVSESSFKSSCSSPIQYARTTKRARASRHRMKCMYCTVTPAVKSSYCIRYLTVLQ
jgi:hypothetical protein